MRKGTNRAHLIVFQVVWNTSVSQGRFSKSVLGLRYMKAEDYIFIIFSFKIKM